MLIAIIIIIVLGLYVMGAYNGLVKERNKVRTNWSQIDVVLKRRNDLIPNLVETVKGYAKHEKETLDAVIKARNTYVSATVPEDQMKAAGEITQALSKIMALSEAYPDLKANTNFLELQKELTETEDKITYARQFYNDSVYGYQNSIEMFPTNIIANLFGFKPFPFFEATESEKAAPKVQF